MCACMRAWFVCCRVLLIPRARQIKQFKCFFPHHKVEREYNMLKHTLKSQKQEGEKKLKLETADQQQQQLTTITTQPSNADAPSPLVKGTATSTLIDVGDRPSQRFWYEMLPKDSEIDAYGLEPLNELFYEHIPDEFRKLDIQKFVREYELIASEFVELSARKRELEPKYSKILMDFIATMCRVYGCKTIPMFVDVNKYTTTKWGPVYWRFMHYSSILLSYAYEHKMVTSYLDFATIVYQIHLILPCSTCKSHYMRIRESQNVIDCIKYIAFGLPVLGVLYFHNLITDNVDNTMLKAMSNHERRKPFTYSNFAHTYECLTITNETLHSSTDYVPSYFDFQSKTHSTITTILATYTKQPYMRVSCRLKLVYNAIIATEYNRLKRQELKTDQGHKLIMVPSSNSGVNSKPYHYDIPPFSTHIMHPADAAFMSMSAKQMQYVLMRAILMQFQNTEYTSEMINNNVDLNVAIIELYNRYPSICLELANRNLSVASSTEMQMKNQITLVIQSIQRQQQQQQQQQSRHHQNQ